MVGCYCCWCCEGFHAKSEKMFCSKGCTWAWMTARSKRNPELSEALEALDSMEPRSEKGEVEPGVGTGQFLGVTDVRAALVDL